jgi:hypothetical protein
MTDASRAPLDSVAYPERCRGILLDMHIPDWDERFLRDFDPAEMARLCAAAGADAVMVYCNSHTGLCNWPARTGRMHPGLGGRDVLGEMLGELRSRGFAVAAYYSVHFNNQTYDAFPDWRIRGGGAGVFGRWSRYGVCCSSHPDYVDFMQGQIEEIVGSYEFDALFLDMVFWAEVCRCDRCRARLRREAGIEIPGTVDWFSPGWCSFQRARERWLVELAERLRTVARGRNRNLPVYLNSSLLPTSWTLGFGAALALQNDLIGGDFFGGVSDLLVASSFAPRPVQYMAPLALSLREHVALKSVPQLQTEAAAALAFSARFLAIDAVDPDGRLNPGSYAQLADVLGNIRRFEDELGGSPFGEDIAVYFSFDSKMSFAENGKPLEQAGPGADMLLAGYPHGAAFAGACRALLEAHLPFRVLNRTRLAELSRFKVLVLPNVLRMDAEEIEAVRAYVRAGGHVYASRFTSLVATEGTRHDDFMLADVFGCHCEGVESWPLDYLKPIDTRMRERISPQSLVSYQGAPLEALLFDSPNPVGSVRIRAATAATEVLATLTRTYRRRLGSKEDRDWASVHSAPPWDDTGQPVVVRSRFGRGAVVYSAADVERGENRAQASLFVGLVCELLGGPPAFEADTHPTVLMTVYDQPERRRLRVSFVHQSRELPPLPVPRTTFRLRPPEGRRFSRLSRLPGGEPVPFNRGPDGCLEAEVEDLRLLEMLAAEYT